MVADLKSIEDCVAAFDRCRPLLHKIHPHPTGIDFDETLDHDEWFLFGKLLKSFVDLPPPDRIELLINYFPASALPPALKGLSELAQWLGQALETK